MFVRRSDLEVSLVVLDQMVDMEESLINAWADAFYRSSVGYFTRADAKIKARKKFVREVRRIDEGELEDYRVGVLEGLGKVSK